MQQDANQDVETTTTGVKRTTDAIHHNSSTLLTADRLDDDVDAAARDHGPDRGQKRQRVSYATTGHDAPLDSSDATATLDKSNFLSTDTQKAKVKKRGFSIAHEFEREISVSTSVSIPADPLPSSPAPSSTAPPSSTDLFSPKPPTPEKAASKPTGRHRRETVSPGRVPVESDSQVGSRRDTLSPDGFQRIASLAQDDSSQEIDAIDDEEKDDMDGTNATERSTAARRASTYDHVSPTPSPPSPTDGGSSAPPAAGGVSRRSTLDPTEVASIFKGRDSLLVPATGRRETLDPLEALAVLQGGVASSHTEDVAVAAAPSSKAPSKSAEPTKPVESNRRETLNPADLMEFNLDDDSSDDDDQVLGSFRTSVADSPEPPTSDTAPQSHEARTRRSVAPSTRANAPEEPTSPTPAPAPKSRVVTKPGPHPSLFSPPVRRNHPTPLKSCLSARKPVKPDDPTPTKTVVFGSPRGAEFRRNDPSTSMTPMCAQRTKEMFPLDKIDSDEDEVTSENTSILDEADHLMEKDEDEVDDDENHSLSFPFGSLRSPTRKRNRASNGGGGGGIKGLSPLDAMADARRQRRASIGASGLQPLQPSSALKPSRRQSLLGVSVMQSNDSLVVGSAKKKPRRAASSIESSSSDDMEITGDYSHVAHQAKPVVPELSNGLGDLWNENYTPPKTSQTAVDSSDEDDQTLELGPIGHLQGDASLFASKHAIMTTSTTVVGTANGVAASSSFMSEVQLTSLHPIAEGEEVASTRSSLVSHLSLSDDDDDDDEDEDQDDPNYDAQRKSLVINLGGKFDKMGSSGKKKRQSPRVSTASVVSLEEASSPPKANHDTTATPSSPPHAAAVDPALQNAPKSENPATRSPSPSKPLSPLQPNKAASPSIEPASPPPEPVSFAELLSMLSLDPVEEAVQTHVAEGSKLLVVTSLLAQKARWTHAIDELSTWLSEMAVEREQAEAKAVPSYLARLVHANAVPHDPVRALYDAHLNSVLAEWFAWRKRLESPTNWTTPRATVDADLAALQRLRVGRDEAHEKAAVQKLVAKELEMERSLEWIQEHQTLRAEASTRIATLETQLETLHQTLAQHDHDIKLHRMKLDEATAAVSSQKMTDRIHLVQEREDLYQIASKLSKWAFTTVSPTALEVQLTVKSLNYTAGIAVSVKIDLTQLTTPDDAGNAVDVSVGPVVARKQHSIFHDIAALVRTALLDPVRLQDMGAATVGQPHGVSSFVQWAEVDLMRSMRLWQELEQVVLQYAVTTDESARQVWVAFVSFRSLVKLRVGLPVSSQFYFARAVKPVVSVEYGAAKVDTRELVRRIEAVPRGFRRVHAICSCVTGYIESLA